MRSVPSDITIAPIPDDFAIAIMDDGRTLKTKGRLNGLLYEIGLRPERTETAMAAARENLRIGMWQLHQFAELGRSDLMAYAAVDRHTNRRRQDA